MGACGFSGAFLRFRVLVPMASCTSWTACPSAVSAGLLLRLSSIPTSRAFHSSVLREPLLMLASLGAPSTGASSCRSGQRTLIALRSTCVGCRKAPPPARRDEVHIEIVGVVAVVVMPVAGHDGHDARAALAGDGGDLEEVLFRVFLLHIRSSQDGSARQMTRLSSGPICSAMRSK